MLPITLACAALALLLALLAFRLSLSQGNRLEELVTKARRAEAAAEEAAERAARVEGFLKMMAEGKKLDRDMIEEGRLFGEVSADEARQLVESDGAAVRVLDVRTEGEVTGGHIAGAIWIPVEEIESRYREVPRAGRVLVVCAAGARSAAACDFLTRRGYDNVENVAGGMSSYRGATVRGRPGA